MERDELTFKVQNLEKDLKDRFKECRDSTKDEINLIWEDQRRQDAIMNKVIERKIECLENVDSKLKEVDTHSEKRVEKATNNWWIRAAIIYGVVILIIGFVAVQTMMVKSDIGNRVTKIEFDNWKNTEFLELKRDIKDLRKEVTEDLREIRKMQIEQLTLSSSTSKMLEKHLKEYHTKE